MRNELAHSYPPVSWRALHQAVEILLEDLDSYKVKIADWLVDQGVLQIMEHGVSGKSPARAAAAVGSDLHILEGPSASPAPPNERPI